MKYRMIQRCREAFPIRLIVPVFARLAQWVLRLGEPTTECAGSGECPVAGTDP